MRSKEKFRGRDPGFMIPGLKVSLLLLLLSVLRQQRLLEAQPSRLAGGWAVRPANPQLTPCAALVHPDAPTDPLRRTREIQFC